MIREACGTKDGALAHQRNAEPWCGWCLHAEATARVAAEGVPARPSRPPAAPEGPSRAYVDVTAEQARAHRERLVADLEAHERGTSEAPAGRRLRRVA